MRKLLLNTMAGAVLVGSIAAASMVSADDAKTAAAKPAAKAKSHQSDSMKVSEDGFNATRAMHAARLAIFNGEPKLCEESLSKANDALDLATKDEAVAKVKNDWIPIDGSLALAETFVPSPEKAAHVAKANEHFQKGDASKGLQELKLGEIDVNFSRVLMPLKATKKRVSEAMDFVKEHKYYEANLVLKAAEDALEFDSVSLFEHAKAKDAANRKGVTKSKDSAKAKDAAKATKKN